MTDTYRTRTDDTWDRAREAYLAGEPAESVCARFDLGLRTFRARAAEQGWRRSDQPDPEPFQIDNEAALDDEIDDAALRKLARARMALAARRGLVGEALRWARLESVIARQAEAARREARDLAREQARVEHEENRRAHTVLRDVTAAARSIQASASAVLTADENRAARRKPHDPHNLHDLHGVLDRADPDDRDPLPQSRADRRRMLKSARKRR